MLNAIKGFFANKTIKITFDSAFAHVRKLPLNLQYSIAFDVQRELIHIFRVSDIHPEDLEDEIRALLQKSTFARQMLVKSGLSTSCDDPMWLRAALLESAASAMLTCNEKLTSHVINSIDGWAEQFQFEPSSPIKRSLDPPVPMQFEERLRPMSDGVIPVGSGRVEVVPEKVRSTKKPRKTKASVAKKKAIKKPTKSKSAPVKKSALSRKKSVKKAATPQKKVVKK